MYTTDQDSVRERLLEGALQCLREKGYGATTARDIAAAADANLRSIGYHFGSTKSLLLAAISLNFRRWLEPLIAAAGDDQRPASERLRSGMALFAQNLADNAPALAAWLEAVAMATHDPELRSVLARNQAEFRDALARSLGPGGTEGEAEQWAGAVVTVCDGLIVRYLLHGEISEPEEVARQAWAALSRLSEEAPAQ